MVSELGKEHGYDDIQSIGYRLVGDIFLLLEAPSKACENFQIGVNFGSNDFWGLDNLIRLGYAQIRNGQTEIGMQNLQRGIDLAKSGGLGIIEILGNQFLCYASTYLGDWEQVRQIAYPLERQARKRSMPLVQVMSQVTQGILESVIGKTSISIEQLQMSVDTIYELEYPIIELRTLIRLIQAKQAYGQETNAQVQRVYEILDCLEQNAHPEEISQVLIEFRQKLLKPISP